jgi:hypothetical protein
MYTRVGLKRPLVRFCARLTSFLFSDPRRATRNKRRVGNQIGAHPFLHHHLVSAFGPGLNYDQLSLLDGRYATVVITLPFMTHPMAAGLTVFLAGSPRYLRGPQISLLASRCQDACLPLISWLLRISFSRLKSPVHRQRARSRYACRKKLYNIPLALLVYVESPRYCLPFTRSASPDWAW